MLSCRVSIVHPGRTMSSRKPRDEKPDPRDREPIDEAPATPADEPPPVPVKDPPVENPKAPYTVTKGDINAGFVCNLDGSLTDRRRESLARPMLCRHAAETSSRSGVCCGLYFSSCSYYG